MCIVTCGQTLFCWLFVYGLGGVVSVCLASRGLFRFVVPVAR